MIKTIQDRIDALGTGKSPKEILDQDELEKFNAVGKDEYVRRQQKNIEYAEERDHW
jgi:hypothetical protein